MTFLQTSESRDESESKMFRRREAKKKRKKEKDAGIAKVWADYRDLLTHCTVKVLIVGDKFYSDHHLAHIGTTSKEMQM